MTKHAAIVTGGLLAVALSTAGVDRAHAGCNLIPGTAKAFNATLGATNRPFAAPGERLEVTRARLRRAPGLSANARTTSSPWSFGRRADPRTP